MQKVYYSHVKSGAFSALIGVDVLGYLCYASLGDNERELVGSMRREFAKKKQFGLFPVKIGEIPAIDATLNTYCAILEDPRKGHLLGAKTRYIFGTSSQQKVWTYLIENTQNGSTTSYKEISEFFGKPGGSRVVANACAANRIALVVPCHRVLTAKGENTGYRWGRDLKSAILRRERMGEGP